MRVEVNGVRLFVDVDGAEYVAEGDTMRRRPTLVLLHGGPGLDHSSFKSELGLLRDEMQLLYVDHRGNGRSEAGPLEGWCLDQWADDLRALLDTLGIERPVVLGQSFGGFVAQAYAIRHPGHACGLIFSSTAATAHPERNLAVFERLGGPEARAAAAAFYEAPGTDTLPEFVSKCMSLYNRHFHDPGGMKRSIVNIDVLLHFFRHEYRRVDLREGLGSLRCPVLVLGGEDDPTTPIEDQEEIAAAIPPPWVDFHRFADCGHGAYRDQPETAIPLIRDFVKRCFGEAEALRAS